MRTSTGKKLAGVCSGIADYLDADPTMVRVLWLILTFALPPAGIIGYIAAWIIMPKAPEALVFAPAPTAEV
jgi:phage shock protein PspC (stress-responsive transcriptional regulator)